MQHIIHSRMNAENKYTGGVHSIYLIDAYVEPASAKWFHKTMLSRWSSFIFILHSINSKWKWLKSWFYSLLKVSLHFSPFIHTHSFSTSIHSVSLKYSFYQQYITHIYIWFWYAKEKPTILFDTFLFIYHIHLRHSYEYIFANGTRWIEWRRRKRWRKKIWRCKNVYEYVKSGCCIHIVSFHEFHKTLWLISVVNFLLSLMNGFSFERS